MLLHEPVLIIQSQRKRKNDQQLLDDVIMHMPRELFDGRPVLLHNFRVRPLGMFRNKLGNVVNLKVVPDARD